MKHFLLFIIATLFFLNGCIIHREYRDDSLDIQYGDATIKTNIVSALLQKDASLAGNVEIYSFNGHVFIIGEAPQSYREFAFNTAKALPGVVSVTPNWFNEGSGNKTHDAVLAAEVEGKLMFDKNISSSSMAVLAWGRNIFLLGTMADTKSIDKAIDIARGQGGVKSVTSYLFPN